MNAEGLPRRDSFRATLLASAGLGAAIGLCFPTAHVAIEPAQVLAGLVHYAPDDPFGLYERRVWTIWHQLLAPLLAAGVPERALCFALSGAIGALGFAALAAFAWACGAPFLPAVAAPLFLWMLDPIRWGFRYPILLLGSPHTYGMSGLAWMVLAVSVLAAGRARLGAFLLAMGPAVHPSLGLWVGIATVVCLLVDWPRTRAQLPDLLRGGGLGVTVAALSLAVHLAGQTPGPVADPAEIERHMNAYFRDWDGHRGAITLFDWNGAVLAVGVAIALQGIVRAGSLASVLAFRVYVACALLGVAFVALHRDVPVGVLPTALLAAMPTRVLNLPMIAFVPLLVAAFSVRRDRAIARWAVLVLGAAALLRYRAPELVRGAVFALGLLALTLLARPSPRDAGSGHEPRSGGVLERTVQTALAIAIAVALLATAWGLPRRASRLLDRSNEPVLAAAAQRSGGLLVAPGLARMQLATRRPLVLDPSAIDMLPYAPSGGPAVARILGEVYGVDFFAPPHSMRNLAEVAPGPVRPVWAKRDAAQWSDLARRHAFEDVIAPPDWKLALPEVARSDFAVLYRVP
jgi:hypothetical protein